jgi:hypothetical protein
MMLRDRSFGDTSNAATVTVTKQICSGTPRVVTATVAVVDVSPHGLSRNVKSCSTMVHLMLTAKFVYIVYFIPAFSQRMYEHHVKKDSKFFCH